MSNIEIYRHNFQKVPVKKDFENQSEPRFDDSTYLNYHPTTRVVETMSEDEFQSFFHNLEMSMMRRKNNKGLNIRETCNIPLEKDPNKVREIVAMAQQGDTDAMSKTILSHMRLVAYVGSQYTNRNYPFSDLIIEGSCIVRECVLTYRHDMNSRFSTYVLSNLRERFCSLPLTKKDNHKKTKFVKEVELTKIYYKLKHLKKSEPTISDLTVKLLELKYSRFSFDELSAFVKELESYESKYSTKEPLIPRYASMCFIEYLRLMGYELDSIDRFKSIQTTEDSSIKREFEYRKKILESVRDVTNQISLKYIIFRNAFMRKKRNRILRTFMFGKDIHIKKISNKFYSENHRIPNRTELAAFLVFEQYPKFPWEKLIKEVKGAEKRLKNEEPWIIFNYVDTTGYIDVHNFVLDFFRAKRASYTFLMN